MLVYHFLPLQFAVKNLENKYLKISTFHRLNDPFELFPMDISDQEFRMRLKNGVRNFIDEIGLICFSKNWSSPLQWAHYADRHKGICLGFEVPKIHQNIFKEVRYVKKKLNLKNVSAEVILEKALYTKYSHWAYENEVRSLIQIHERDPVDGNYYMPFENNLVLRKVILGASCDIDPLTIKNLLLPFGTDVDVFKVRAAFTKFSMVRDQRVKI